MDNKDPRTIRYSLGGAYVVRAQVKIAHGGLLKFVTPMDAPVAFRDPRN
jgi:hypothetical protein